MKESPRKSTAISPSRFAIAETLTLLSQQVPKMPQQSSDNLSVLSPSPSPSPSLSFSVSVYLSLSGSKQTKLS